MRSAVSCHWPQSGPRQLGSSRTTRPGHYNTAQSVAGPGQAAELVLLDHYPYSLSTDFHQKLELMYLSWSVICLVLKIAKYDTPKLIIVS